MGKISKVVVCGSGGVGKTAILRQAIYGDHLVGEMMFSTIEDTYVAYIDTDRGTREVIRFYDTAAVDMSTELPRHYIATSEGFVLVYDVTSMDSFKALRNIKRDIDKYREKKEVTIICLGNRRDQAENRAVSMDTAQAWANKEKIKLFEVSAADRASLMDTFVYLASRLTQPPSKSGLTQFMRKKRENGR